jgi:hypothetical protein
MKNAYYGVPATQNFAFGGIANPTQRATLRSSDKEYLDARQKELDEFEKQRTAYNDSLTKWQTEFYNPYKSQVEAYNTGAQKYNTDVYEPYKKQFDDYVKAVETWNAGDRTTDYAGPAEPTLAKTFDLTAPVAPEDFKGTAPVAPFKEEEVMARQKEAAARATQDAGNRAVAIDVVSDPDRFNFGSMSVSNRFMAKGGEVMQDDSREKAARSIIKDFESYGYSKEEIMALADEVAAAGRGGDELLAYLSPESVEFLKEQGGSGTINPATGLPEFLFESSIKNILTELPKLQAAETAAAAADKAAAEKAAADAKELAAFRAKDAAVSARWNEAVPSKPATTTAAVDLNTAISQLKAGDNAAANLTMRQIVGLDPMPSTAIPNTPVAKPVPTFGQTPAIKTAPIAQPKTFTPAVPPRPEAPPTPRADDTGFGIPKPPSGTFVPGAGQYGVPTSSDGKWLYSSGKWYPNETISVSPVTPPKDDGFADTQAVVYGPDGKRYSNPRQAREAGVTNYTYEPPKAPVTTPPPAATRPVTPPSIPYTPPAVPGQVSFPGMTRPGSPPAASTPISTPTMPTYSSRGVGAVGTADTVANKNYFALTPETSTGLAPGSAAIGPADMPLPLAKNTMGALGANPYLSPTMLGGQQNAGVTTDRLGNRIYGFAKGGGVDVNALLAQNTETLSDEVPDEVINTDPVGTAQKMLADLGKAGKVSPTRQSIKRVKTSGGGGATADKAMQMPFEGLGRGDLGAMKDVTPTAKNPDSARAQMEELARVYQLKIRAAQDKGKGLSANTFGAPTLEGPTLTKNRLTKKRFKDGGEAKKPEGELSQEEIDAASRPAFVTPKSGRGRKQGEISRQLQSGDAYINMAKGVTELPYDLAGAPMDIAMLVRQGLTGQAPAGQVGTSDYIKNFMTERGIRQAPPADPTAKGFYTAGELLSNLTNPAGVTRAGVKAAQKTGEAATAAAKDFEQYNRQLSVPGASYAVKPRGGTFATSGSIDAPPISKMDKMLEEYRGALKNKLPEDQHDVVDMLVDKKMRKYFTNEYGTAGDPLRTAMRSGALSTHGSDAETFPEYLIAAAQNPEAKGHLQAKRHLEKFYDQGTGIDLKVLGLGSASDADARSKINASVRDFEQKQREAMSAEGFPVDFQNPPWVEKYAFDDLKSYPNSTEVFRNMMAAGEEGRLPTGQTYALKNEQPIYDINNPRFEFLKPNVLAETIQSLDPKKIKNMSFDQAVIEGTKNMQVFREYDTAVERAAKGLSVPKEVVSMFTKPILKTDAGEWVKLTDPRATKLEGKLLHHSVGGYADNPNYNIGGPEAFRSGKAQVFSLRKERNAMPEITIEAEKTKDGLNITQIRGDYNSFPSHRAEDVFKFLDKNPDVNKVSSVTYSKDNVGKELEQRIGVDWQASYDYWKSGLPGDWQVTNDSPTSINYVYGRPTNNPYMDVYDRAR